MKDNNKKIKKTISKKLSNRIKNNIVIVKRTNTPKQKIYGFDDIHNPAVDEDLTGVITTKDEFEDLLDKDFTVMDLYSTDEDSPNAPLPDSENPDENDQMDEILATYSGLDLSDEKI